MAFRAIFWLALLFAAAVAAAVFSRLDIGQVMIVYAPYRLDVSLNFFIAALIVIFVVLYALIRMTRNVWKMPARVTVYRQRARAEKAQRALRDALNQLYSGRFAYAEKAARSASAVGSNRAAASLVAASAAHRMRQYARREDWLEKIDAPDWQDARLMAMAEMRAEARDAEGAFAALAAMPSPLSQRIRAQQIALRVFQQLERWSDVLKLVKALEKRHAIDPAAAVRLRQTAVEQLLRDCRHNADALLELWGKLAAAERQSPRLADLAAELLIALDQPVAAARCLEEALAHHWDARLLRRYADCAGTNPLPLIYRAQAWEADHPDDADLLFTLGQLCLCQKLWGKAQSFLEKALSLSGDNEPLKVRIYRTLAQLYDKLGDSSKANEHYRESVMAMRAF